MALAAGSKGYLVDSSTLVNLVAILTGTDPRHAVFREWLWASFQLGLLNISRAIEEEIERNSPTLSKLLKKRGVKPIDFALGPDPTVAEAEAMLKQLKAEGRITSDKCVGVNDLRIILIAELYGLAVVTDEAQGKDRCNIPTFCRERGVPCVSSADLFAERGFLTPSR